MAVKFTRVLGIHTFFSVFLPGLTLLVALYPLLPFLSKIYPTLLGNQSGSALENLLPVFGLVIFITLGLFVGFVVHVLGAQLEKFLSGMSLPIVGVDISMGKPHRDLFGDLIQDNLEEVNRGLINPFLFVAAYTFPYINLPLIESEETEADASSQEDEPANRMEDDTIESLYILVRANVQMEKTGRSRTFQAVFAACRTMSAVFLICMVAYLVYAGVSTNSVQLTLATDMLSQSTIELIGDRKFSTIRVFASAGIIGPLGMYTFARAAHRMKQFYLEYLVGDFLLLHSDVADDLYDGDEPVNQPRYWQSILPQEKRRQ